MKILFYVEPLIEQDKPYWKDGWAGVVCRDIINTLKQSENSYEFLLMTNEAIAQKVDIGTPIVQLTQKELLSPFETTNYMDVTTAWHCETYTNKQLKEYKKLMIKKLDGFLPDIIITFSPVPFFKEMFPKTLILHHEFSIFSRLPYPQSWFLDPIGMHSNLFLNKFEDEIKSIKLTEKQTNLLSNFKNACQNILYAKSPFKNIFEEKRNEFDYLVLLPLQFSRYYSFDDIVPFKSQYEYCVYVLDNTPPNIGVVVNTHPEYPIISKEAIEFLKTKYPNFIYEEEFNTIYASGQFILPFVDAVITVSSSLGLQTLFLDKKLITLSDKTFSFIADETNIYNIEKTLKKEKISKDTYLYYILTHHAITQEYMHNSKWLDKFLSNSFMKYNSKGITFDFYEPIDTDENIFNSILNTMKNNLSHIPQYLGNNFIQLFIEDENGMFEENSIKYPVLSKDELQKFEFNLSNFVTIKNLRLDPLNDSCVIEIDSIVLKKQDTSVDLMPYISSNCDIKHSNSYFFTTNDSQIYFENLPSDIFENTNSMEVSIRYAHISKDALEVTIKQELEQTKQELANIYTSKSWKLTRPLRKIMRVLRGG